MINVEPYINQLNNLKNYFDNYFIEDLCFKYKWYLRVIYGVPIKFPDYYTWVNHDSDIELTNIRWHEHPRQGWGTKKSNKMKILSNDIELWYLWVNVKITRFDKNKNYG